MSARKKKSIYTARSSYTDRAKVDKEDFSELTAKLQTIDSALLLLSSKEETVLISVFRHIAEFIRKQDENIAIVKERNVLQLLLDKDLYLDNESLIVRRFALFVATTILESMNTLLEFETEKVMQILNLCMRFYLAENDDYCLEYLSVMVNKCLDDPQVAREIHMHLEYLDKFYGVTTKTANPDILLHSIEALHKMLLVLGTEDMLEFTEHPEFPTNRVLCDLTNEFKEVRSAALKVVKVLILNTGSESPFGYGQRPVFVLQQLTRVLCDDAMEENTNEVVDTLSTGLRTEKMTQIFFEQNLFDRIIQNLDAHAEVFTLDTKCKIIAIFAEAAKYNQFLYRLHAANVTELFLSCLLQKDSIPSTHVVVGLNRMMKYTEAANKIVAAYDEGIIARLLRLMEDKEINIRTREQSAELLCNLLVFAYHGTAAELMSYKLPDILGAIFSEGLPNLSIDYILSMLSLIENLAQNEEYRFQLGQSMLMTTKLALLLKNSFTAAIVVSSIFRCLCTLIDEQLFRDILIATFLTASIKRGLKSLSNLVKTSVTNFIMQTTRFPNYVADYIDGGVLEVLMMHQKHSFCISTWGAAIDSILSKTPSLKFCIRNHLSFTDTTVGYDFQVSKHKFEDFRVFQSILKEDVSPLHPILLVNFERPENPSALVVTVPPECFVSDANARPGMSWCYCRKPGDGKLPKHLEDLKTALERYGLVMNPAKIKRCIDFDNVAKRAKVVAEVVSNALSENLKPLDLNSPEECSRYVIRCHLKELCQELHCNFIPIGAVRSGCQFERAILFKALCDQIGLPCTLQRSVDGKILFNEVPLPVKIDQDVHCDPETLKFLPWRMLRPTHIVDLMFNVGELYPIQSRQALQYLRLY